MKNTINLSDKAAVSFRKVIGFVSLLLSIVMIVIVLCGGIPFFRQGSNLIKMTYDLFEIFNVTSKPILYCLVHFVFAVIYFVLLVFAIKDFVAMIKTIKIWLNDAHDTKIARFSLTNCVSLCNEMFVKFVILAALSYVLDSYKLSVGANLVFALLVLFDFAINFMKVLLVKRNLSESFFAPLVPTLVLIIAALFMFNSLNFELDLYIRQFFNFFRMIFTLTGVVSWGYVFKTLILQVLLPAFGVYVLVRLILLFIGSMSYGMKFVNFEKNCKTFMITNLIAFGVVVIILMVSEGTFILSRLLDLIFGNLEFVLLGAAVFIILFSI